MKKTCLIFLLFFFCISCGSISVTTVKNDSDSNSSQTSENVSPANSQIFVYATDYVSSGQIYLAALTSGTTELTNTGLTYLGSSAIIRLFDDLLFILHDGFSAVSSDNVQIVDLNDQYSTIAQFSTGNGTNPHDVVVSGNSAFITLYNPSADENNTDPQGNPGDVIEMDLTTGEILNRYSFYDDLNDDGDLNANAHEMILVGSTLYVLVQDLESNTLQATSPGLLGMIDIENHQVLGVITLRGRNPVSMAINTDQDQIAIVHMATYDFSLGNFDTDEPYGGIEIVDLATQSSLAFFDDEDFGGYLERIKSDDENYYVTVSEFDVETFSYSSQLIRFAQNTTSSLEYKIIDDSGTDIRDFVIDGDYLWVSRRQINTNSGLSEPKLEVLDLNTQESMGEILELAAPGMSCAAL